MLYTKVNASEKRGSEEEDFFNISMYYYGANLGQYHLEP